MLLPTVLHRVHASLEIGQKICQTVEQQECKSQTSATNFFFDYRISQTIFVIPTAQVQYHVQSKTARNK